MLARAHPNVLTASAWLNQLYHVKSGKTLEGVDLSVPLTYAEYVCLNTKYYDCVRAVVLILCIADSGCASRADTGTLIPLILMFVFASP